MCENHLESIRKSLNPLRNPQKTFLEKSQLVTFFSVKVTTKWDLPIVAHSLDRSIRVSSIAFIEFESVLELSNAPTLFPSDFTAEWTLSL